MPSILWKQGALLFLDSLDDDSRDKVFSELKNLNDLGLKDFPHHKLRKLKTRQRHYVLKVNFIRVLFELCESNEILIHDIIKKKSARPPKGWGQ